MAGPSVAWDRLSPEARASLAFAAAMRQSDVVGTKGLLAGIMRASGSDSTPDQLLRYAGVDRARLFDELVRATTREPIDPNVEKPSRLRELPALTPHATEALRAAAALADPEPVGTAHLFAGILEIPESSAYVVLDKLLGGQVPLARVAKASRDYLSPASTTRFADVLESLVPSTPAATYRTLFGLTVTDSVFRAAGGGAASAPLTATALAAELLAHHREYGRDRARLVQLDPSAGESAPVAVWFDRVRSLLRPQPPPLVHGRLFVVALARLDPNLRDQLSEGDLLAAVEGEIREPLEYVFVAAPPEPPRPPRAALALTVSARQVLTYANAMLATLPQGAADVAASRAAILFGTLHYATTGASPTAANHLLAAVIGEATDPSARLDGAAGALGMTRVRLADLSPIADSDVRDGPLAASLARANACREQTGAEAIHLRHLLADALSVDPPTVPVAMLTALGVGLSVLRGVLRTVIDRFVTEEPAEVWNAILAEAPDSFDLAGGLSSDAVDPTRGIKQTDDHLGVSPYVGMLAAVIADSRTPEPLSIGLFGEWGSGKSYFMGLLREQVDAFAAHGDPYFRGIRQIGFNAWHYADTNIWASLGDEIFEQLAGPRPSAGEQRDQLRAELSERLQRRKELQAATERAQEETRRLSEELEQANADRRVSAGDLALAAASSPRFRARLDAAWKKLGVADEVERGYLLGQEVRGTAAEIDALRALAKGPRGMVLIAAAAAAVVLLAVGIVVAPDLGRWLAGGGVAVIGALLSTALVFVGRIRSGLRILHSTSADIATSLDERRHAALKQGLDSLRAAEAKERVLQAQHDQVVERIGELGRELTELSPGQRLYHFVTERADSDEYRRHLGLISTVRKDFEELIDLLKDWRTNGGPEGTDSIDRIVLYIDDLDRCSPQQVVEVLQAVHLLLALDLFVVVVGVDPRWLLRSLQSEYDRVLTSEREAAKDTWQASPHDYLEKIFNIPFALPRMSPRSFQALLQSFSGDGPRGANGSGTETVPAPPHGTSLDDGRDGTGPAEVASAAQTGAQIALEPLHVEEGSEASTAASGAAPIDVRPLTERELTLLASLAPLVETPREAKRLVNLYRLVRSTRNLRTATRFLGDGIQPGEYEAVVILLGLLSGHGRLLERVLAAPPAKGVAGGLVHRRGGSSWQVFARGLEPRETESGWENDVVGAIEPYDVALWRQLHEGLTGATKLVTLRDLEAFQFWAPQIVRFSFLLSPYLQERTSEDGSAAGSRTPVTA